MGYGIKISLPFIYFVREPCGTVLTQSCLSFSAIIFFFVKIDVQKRTSTESMPLLIDDRVGLLGLFLVKSYDSLCRILFCVLCLGYTSLLGFCAYVHSHVCL